MKNVMLAFIAALSLSFSAFANAETRLEANAKAHFAVTYGQREVKWELHEQFAKATYTEDGTTHMIYYNADGAPVGHSSFVTLKELPASGLRRLEKRYAGSTITEAYRWVPEEGNETFYVTIVDAKGQKLLLELAQDGSVSFFKKLK